MPISINLYRAQECLKRIEVKLKHKHRKLLVLSKKLPLTSSLKKQRDRRLLETAETICSEIKDLTLMKKEYNKRSLAIIDMELRKVENEIESRQEYLLDYNINPVKALEQLENIEKAESTVVTKSSKKQFIDALVSKSKSKDRKRNGKQCVDVTSSEDSVAANSDTYAFSIASKNKSPSRLETFSCFETSPILKRVKVSEEEEKSPILNDNFSIGDSVLINKTPVQPIRKSNRRRIKSKILRELTGEDFYYIQEEKEVKTKNRKGQDIIRMQKLDEKIKQNEEIIPFNE